MTLLSITLVARGAIAAPGEGRSETTATVLSLGATVGSYAILGVGFFCPSPLSQDYTSSFDNTTCLTLMRVGSAASLVAPNAGHWYANHWMTLGLGVRLLGAAFLVPGWWIASGALDADSGSTGSNLIGGGIMILAGGIAYAAGTAHDIGTAARAVRDYNTKHSMMIAPIATSNSAGLVLTGSF